MAAERDVDPTVDAFYSSGAPTGAPPGQVASVVPAPSSPVPPAGAPQVASGVPPVGRDRPAAGPLRGLPPLVAPAVTAAPAVPARRRPQPRDGRSGSAGGARLPRTSAPAGLGEPLAPTPAEIERLRSIAMGRTEADFAIRGGVVLVVQTGELLRRDILIAGRYIAAITRPGAERARRSLDAAGRFVLPAYVDARTSVERTLLPPGELARLVVPRGTVTVLTDPAQLERLYGPRGRTLVLRTDTPIRVLPRGPVEGGDGDPAQAWPGAENAAGAAGVTISQVVPRQAGPAAGGSAAFLPGTHLPAPDLPVSNTLVPDALAPNLLPPDLLASDLLAPDLLGADLLGAESLAPSVLPPDVLAPDMPGPRLRGVHPGTEAPPHSIGGAFAFTHLDDLVREEIRAGAGVASAVRAATLTPARAFGLDHVLGLIAPARLADLQIVRDLTARVPPDVVIAGGRIAAERGRALFDNFDPAPQWAQSSVRLPVGLYTGSFTSPCMHWGSRRDTRLTAVDVRVPGDPESAAGAGFPGADQGVPRVGVVRLEPTLRDGVVVADPSRDLLKTAVLDRSGRADRVRVGMVRGIGLTRGALGATAVAAPGDMVIVGAGDADMLTAARALEGMGGGFVVVERGWVLAACPLPVAGLMSDAPWEAVLGQLAAVDTTARDLGCRLASPLRTLSQLGRELYVRP